MLTSTSVSILEPGEAPPEPASLRHGRLWRGLAWAGLGKAWTALAAIIVNVLLSRLLAPEEFAGFLLAFSFVNFSTTFAVLGLNVSIVPLVARSIACGAFAEVRQTVRKTAWLGLSGVAIVSGAYYLTSPMLADSLFHERLLGSTALPVALWIALQSITSLLGETFRGLHDIRRAVIFGGAVANTAWILMLASCLGQSVNLATVVSLAVCTLTASVLIGGWLLWRDLGRLPAERAQESTPHPGSLTIIELLRHSLPLMVTLMFSALINLIDLWVVGAYCPATDLALYGATMRIMLIPTLPLFVVNAAIAPSVAEFHSLGKQVELERLLRTTATLAGLPALASLVILAVGRGWLLEVAFGPFYRQAEPILLTLCAGQLVFAWGGSPMMALMMTGRHRGAIIVMLATVFYMAVAGMICAPKYGTIGVALVSASAAALNKLALLLFCRLELGVWTPLQARRLWPPLFLRTLRETTSEPFTRSTP